MAGLVRGVQWWWVYFKRLLGLREFSRGVIVLGPGRHEIEVATECPPIKVYISTGLGPVPTCGGDITTAGTSLGHNGFVLYADVKSGTCEIEWVAEYEENCRPANDRIR